MKERNIRVRPNVDDKIITSWNALLIDGFIDAYNAFGNPSYLQKAKDAMAFLLNNAYTNNRLVHSYKEGSKQTEGFLEDYAFLSKASLSMYAATLDTTYLELGNSLMTIIQDRFEDESSGMFRYNEDNSLISKIIKTDDGVLPSPNTIVAQNLLELGHLYYDTAQLDKAQSMMITILPRVEEAMNNYAQWSSLMLATAFPFYEVVVVGPNASSLISELHKEYIPNALIAGSSTQSELPLYEDRYFEDGTYIYVCFNNTCKLPVETTSDAMRQLRSFQRN
ncbi:MAG: thioredoxin domain-containing protein [Flavobacteriaceae bacterium]|nr:MAG: thioredoxin domain-containing protein [Flavobacteriaceae bacterium]